MARFDEDDFTRRVMARHPSAKGDELLVLMGEAINEAISRRVDARMRAEPRVYTEADIARLMDEEADKFAVDYGLPLPARNRPDGSTDA